MSEKPKSKIMQFITFYKPHKKLFILDMTCAFLMAAIDVAFPIASRYALQTLLPETQYTAFFWLIVCVASAFLLRTLMQYTVTYLGHMLGVYMEADMRKTIFSHLQKLPFSFYDKSRTGYLMSRCTSDLFDITELAHHGPEDLFISTCTLLGSFIVMLTVEWRLALVMIVAVPVMVFFVLRLRNTMNSASKKVKEGMAIINSNIESSISGARVAQAFTNENKEIEKFEKGNQQYIIARKKYFKTMATFMTGIEFFTSTLHVLVLGFGGYLIMSGRMNLIGLFTFSLYITTFITPLRRLSNAAELFTMGTAGFSRFTEILSIKPDIDDAPDAVQLKNVKGDIEFKNVAFGYGDSELVLKNVCLTVQAGKTLALVGPSGGGKTTLCHLIPRFYQPTDGVITIDGKDISKVTLQSLRGNIGIVQQDVFLFADSIKENIRYGRQDATDDEIVDAAIAADIHQDILAMPDGYNTVVGERGITLSGGQKQRISIARIFLKNPPILILDEATSALDSATEARINSAFDRLAKGRTTLVIAHRLSTVRNADEIIVIDEEGIREQGTHKELLAKKGVYYELNRVQNKEEDN